MSEEYEERFYDLEDYRMTLEDLETMRKQYERLRYERAELNRKLEALRNEVKAWRDADLRHDLSRYVMGDGNNDEVMRAKEATDTLNALEDER
jgi:hypothetical protein